MKHQFLFNMGIVSRNSCENTDKKSENPSQFHTDANSSRIENLNDLYNVNELFDILFVVFPLVAGFLNFTSCLVFIKWQRTPMRNLLLYLSINEIGFNLSFALSSLLLTSISRALLKFNNHLINIIFWIILMTMWTLINASIIMRNWAVMLISFARWEAIKFPTKSRKICKGRSLKLILFVLSAISVSYGIIRLIEIKIVMCQDLKQIHIEHEPFNALYSKVFLNFGFVVLQGFGPVLLVFIFSIALFYEIRVWNRQASAALASSPEVRPKMQVHFPVPGTVIGSVRRVNRKSTDEFKNKTVLALCIVFCALEIPQCVMNFLVNNELFDSEILSFAMLVTHRLLFIDSLSNFVIYIASNKKYRKSLSNFIRFKSGRFINTAISNV